MGPTLIVVAPPGFDDGLCLGQGGELVHVQAFITNATVEPKNGNRRVRSPQFLASGRPEGWLLSAYIAWSSQASTIPGRPTNLCQANRLSSYSPETSPETWKPIPGVGRAADCFS